MSYKFRLPTGFNPQSINNKLGISLWDSSLRVELGNKGGLYILFIWVKVKNGIIVPDNDDGGEYKLLPFYGGESDILFPRLNNEHFPNYSRITRSYNSGIYNFCYGQKVDNTYQAMKIFNEEWIELDYKGQHKKSLQLKLNLYKKLKALEAHNQHLLLFFQCSSFWDFNLNKLPILEANLRDLKGHKKAWPFYGLDDKSPLVTSLKNTKKMISEKFIFAYCELGGSVNERLFKEAECKFFLQKEFGIYLPNHMNWGKANFKRWEELSNNINVVNPFDFSEIEGLIYRPHVN